MTPRLRVGVPDDLLEVAPDSGHGKVWNRVLTHLRKGADVSRLSRRVGRRPQVVLSSGHADLPARRAPLVVQIHEAAWFDPHLRGLLSPAFLAEIEPRTEAAVRAAAHVIVPSHAAARDVTAAYGLDSSRVHAVHHGVDPVFEPDAPGGRALVKAALGRDAPYVIYAGMVHPRKNLASLRAAMAGLAAEGFPHALVVAGGPATDREDVDDLEREAAAELPGAPGRVARFVLPTDRHLAGLMAGADALCLPSHYEGFGIPVVEAMACGTPAVVSDRGALPEVVADTGVVATPEPGALREALRGLLSDSDRLQSLGRAAARRAEAFTWERTAAGWLEVLETAGRRGQGEVYTRGP